MTEPDSLAEYLNRELMRSYREKVEAVLPCMLCGQLLAGHDQDACDAKMAAWKPTGFLSVPVADLPPLTAVKATAYVPYTHELLVDSGGHVCDGTCLTLYGNAYVRIPGPLPWHTRARYVLRRARRRLARAWLP